MRGAKPVLVADNTPIKSVPSPPDWLSCGTKAEWNRVISDLIDRNILIRSDYGSLENYCVAILGAGLSLLHTIWVEDHIRGLCEQFVVQEIAFDPHLARNILNNPRDDDFPAVEMRQGWVTMAPAYKELERAIIARRLAHGGHPILRWHFQNAVTHTDSAGNRMLHKGKPVSRLMR